MDVALCKHGNPITSTTKVKSDDGTMCEMRLMMCSKCIAETALAIALRNQNAES